LVEHFSPRGNPCLGMNHPGHSATADPKWVWCRTTSASHAC
jgi:hypothetical protein